MRFTVSSIKTSGMRWLQRGKDRFEDYLAVEPIECPRGWGSVTFVTSASVYIPVFLNIGHNCPIAGVNSCKECRYRFNPDDVEGMRERLSKLETLRVEREITEEEYELRRRRIIELREETQRSVEENFRAAAWIVGPIGLVVGTVGGLLAWGINLGFLAFAIMGALALGLALGFLYLSVPREK